MSMQRISAWYWNGCGLTVSSARLPNANSVCRQSIFAVIHYQQMEYGQWKTRSRASFSGPLRPVKRSYVDFVGFAQFYGRFARNFAGLTAPLTWMWTPVPQSAFEEVRNLFSGELSLSHPTMRCRLWFIRTPVTSQWVQCYRSGMVVSYGFLECRSKQFSSAKRRYTTHDRELCALVMALEVWRHHLIGATVHVFTDSICLTHLRQQPQLSARQYRWMELLRSSISRFVIYLAR